MMFMFANLYTFIHVHIHLYERWKKRPTKKARRPIPSAGNPCRTPPGRLAQQQTLLGQNLPPIQSVFDLTDAIFPQRHAGDDLGVGNTRIGPKRPYLHILCLCCFFPPTGIKRFWLEKSVRCVFFYYAREETQFGKQMKISKNT